VPARATVGPYAGRRLSYRCTYSQQPGGTGGTLCEPERPPPIPGVVTS
jgi:hypothetical protein